MEHGHRLVVVLVGVMLMGVPAAAATVRTWDGGGSDSYWQTTGNWSPGGYSASDALVVLSGSPKSVDNVIVHGYGTVTVDGPTAAAYFYNNFLIADASGAFCQVNILNGGSISNTGGALGQASGGSGTATVNGVGSTWINRDRLYVGQYGRGVLNIINGGTVLANIEGNLGYYSGSSGTAIVSGAGSRFVNNNNLNVGRSGAGVLDITNGGTVSNSGGYLGRESGGSGEATVSGAGSRWTSSGSLYVGDLGRGSLSITDGGNVSNTYGHVGYDTTGSGTATVRGVGSAWTNSSYLYVGESGAGALNIADGGRVSNTHGYLGKQSDSEGEATVSGAGSAWTNSSYLYVGYEGTGTLSITNGGRVSSTYGYMGQVSGSSGEATVSGAGSVWDNDYGVYVGYSGTGTLNVANGGEVTNTTGYIGRYSGSSGEVAVSGAGSTWINGLTLYVGREGAGTLSITDGGSVSNAAGYVGYGSGSEGTVTVGGTASSWTNSEALNVGHAGTGTVTITDGGAVNVAKALTIGVNSTSDGTINLEGGSLTAETIAVGGGAASFNWTGGTLGITGSSGLRLDSTGLLGANVTIDAGKGLKVAAETDVRSGVTLAVTGGTFSTDVLDVSGTALLRGGVITLGRTFAVGNGGKLEIAGQDVTLTISPKLNSGCELVFDDTTLTMPSLALPSGGSLDLDSGKISAAGTFDNEGVVRMGDTGAAVIRANGLLNNGVIMGKGTIQAEVDNRVNMGFSGDVFFTEDVKNNDESALITISGGAGATFYEDVINHGELRVGVGCTATFYGELSGNGTTGTGTVYLDGDMRPGASPGEMAFGGDLVFGMAASLETELAGTSPGTEYDVLDVAGELNLAGTLNVVLIDGFDPEFGDTFDLLDWGALHGTFNTVNLPRLDPGLVWNTSGLYSDGTLAVVPEPATLSLLALGGLALMIRRRRETVTRAGSVAAGQPRGA